MSETDKLTALSVESSRNTVLSWLFVAVLSGNLISGVVVGRYEPVLFSAVAITIVLVPVIAFRDPTVLPPWYFLLLLCFPVLWETFAPQSLVTPLAPSIALATLGLLLAVVVQRFTTLRLVPWFAVVLTVLFTLAMAGLLNILRWSSDTLFETTYLLDGRTQDAINAAMMYEFMYVTVAGLLSGALFYVWFQNVSGRPDSRMSVSPPSPTRTKTISDTPDTVLSDRLGISRRRQDTLVRGMQVILVAIFVYGFWTRQLPVLTNAALALAITFLPALLERDHNISIEPGLALWVTCAVFLHALGTAGLYDAIGNWDNLTHTLSATVVAAAGYTILRAIDLHTSEIHLPPWAMFALTLVFVLAMGVIWEIFEFFVDQGALIAGIDPVLAQHGIDDTVVDMLFNVAGAIIVATWGTVYLVGVSESLAARLEERFGV